MERGSSDRVLPVLLSKKSGISAPQCSCSMVTQWFAYASSLETKWLLRSSLSDSSPGGSLKLKQLSSKHFEPVKAEP